jgi:chemotaxis protein histidine kinase CheA
MTYQGEFEQQLELLGEEFRLSLPERIVQIEQHWARLRELGVTARAERASRTHRRSSADHVRQSAGVPREAGHVLRELARVLHSLAGTAPMFGFAALGAAARRAEDALTKRGNAVAAELMREVLEMMFVHLEEKAIA